MAITSVFERSVLGARVRSPLGAFIGRIIRTLEIETVPVFILDGGTYQITGSSFDATQGTGEVYISQFPVMDSGAIPQTIVSWSDDLIVFTADIEAIPNTGIFWIHVFNSAGATDFAATTADAITGIAAFVNGTISMAAGETLCGYAAGSYRRFQTGLLYDELTDAGYLRRGSGGRTFFHESEGFSLIGATSGKTVEYGVVSSDTIYLTGVSAYRSNQYCGVEGLFSFYRDGQIALAGTTPANVFAIAYSTTLDANTYGWTNGETLYLVPKNPLSVQVTQPQVFPLEDYVSPSYPPGTTITLDAYAYDKSGSRDSSIEWYNDTTLIGSGASISYTLPGTPGVSPIYAQAETAFGMARVALLNVIHTDVELDGIFPYGGPTTGGTVVYLYGLSFTNTCTVEFDGVAATSVVVLTTNCLQCVAPAGTGSVDVTVIDGATSATLPGGFTYGAAADITITGVSPDNGPSAGGTACALTGTGFTADCDVIFGYEISGPVANNQDNIAFVSSTSITFDSAGTGTRKGPFAIFVYDTVTGVGAVLPDAFIYT